METVRTYFRILRAFQKNNSNLELKGWAARVRGSNAGRLRERREQGESEREIV